MTSANQATRTTSGSTKRKPVLAGARRAARALSASYRVRLLAWFVALLGLGTIATVAVVGEFLLQSTDERIRGDLVQESEEFRSLVGGTDPATGEPFGTNVERIFDVFLDRNVPARNEVVLTFVDGEFYRRSRSTPHLELQLDHSFVADVSRAAVPGTGRYQSDAGAVDFLTVPINVDGAPRGVFVVAVFRDIERAEQDIIVRAVTSVGLVLLLIGSVLAWRLADRVLEPVRRTTATARAINESDLQRRVDVRGSDEVAELAQTFNEMLDRVETAIEEQRRFMDDAGHELRTPLTIVRGHLELLEYDDPEERKKTIELIVDEVDRMTRIVNDLTLLAVATRPDFVRRSEFSVSELMAATFAKARVLGDRDWRLWIADDTSISADRQRLAQALIQLAQNAVQHTEPGDTIELGASAAADQVRLWVGDTGPGIPVDEQGLIFSRFYRVGAETRGQGKHTGLGLSIVSAIAEAHGGSVAVDSRPGAGAKFTITVPRQRNSGRWSA